MRRMEPLAELREGHTNDTSGVSAKASKRTAEANSVPCALFFALSERACGLA